MKRLLPLILIVSSYSVQAQGDDWLTRASEAVRTTNYRGVLVYLREGQMDTLRIVHRYQDGNERERLVSLSGEPREIIRDNGVVTCVLPNRQVVLVARHAMQNLLSHVAELADGLQDSYEIKDLGDERLADRSCRVVAVQPRDAFRYGYRLLIDKQTNLPLKLELMRDSQVLEQMMFTDIEFPEQIPDEALEPTFDTSAFRWVRHQAAEVDAAGAAAVESDWHATDLPPGFRMAETGWRRVAGGSMARQLLFTDGIATVSAFIAAIGERPFVGATTMGAVNAFGRQVNDRQITVVGEVPRQTVRFIAEHLEKRPASAAAEP